MNEKSNIRVLLLCTWLGVQRRTTKKKMQDKKHRHQLKETSIAQRSPPLARNRNTTTAEALRPQYLAPPRPYEY